MALEQVADDVWIADGPSVSFFSFEYPTRMGIVRLPSGTLWVWSPIAMDDALAASIGALGEVTQIVEPNKLHHLALAQWKARFPEAKLYAPPGLASRVHAVSFDAELGDDREPDFEGVVEQVVVGGSFAMQEVLFCHLPSKTLFVGDLIQKLDPSAYSRWRRWIMKADGLTGPDGSTPREWRATFLDRDKARRAVRRALTWQPERMVIAHGAWVREGGAEALRASFRWLLD